MSRNSCDIGSGSYSEHRLCFHTSSGNINGGYRCGTTTSLNGSTSWERVVYAPSWSDDFEAASPLAAEWWTSGDAAWFVSSDTAYEGSFSAECGDISDNQQSALEVILDYSEAGTISFYHQESTEANYDVLYFYIDGIQQAGWSGENAWQWDTFNVDAGVHTMKWEYVKDSSIDSYDDTVWIDVVLATHSIPL